MITTQELRNAIASKNWPNGFARKADDFGLAGFGDPDVYRLAIELVQQIERNPTLRGPRQILLALMDGSAPKARGVSYVAR